MTNTLKYYDENASVFAENTLKVDFNEVQNKFMSLLPDKAYILDFGCGAGRDTKAFIDKGFKVDAIDGSKELCVIASRNTGIKVRQMLFEELSEIEKYDGIWACASILHLPKERLKIVFNKMIKALKPGGYIYASFKYGDFEGERNERYFTDFTFESLAGFMEHFPELNEVEKWKSCDARPGREDEMWLNLIFLKMKTGGKNEFRG